MKLFPRIFLSFWVATILMIAAVLTAGELWPGSFPGDRERLFEPESAASVLTKAVNEYERQGSAAFLSAVTIRHRSLFLFDQEGKVLVKDGIAPPFDAQMAAAALRSGHSEISRFDLSRFGSRMMFACPVKSATGRHYAAVMTVFEARNRLLRPHFWFNLTIAMIPAAIVCILLSLYFTRPITRLRATAQRLAGGDLSARSSPHGIVRRDELGDLARDFDVMAAQIQLLMTAQRRFVADVSHELGARSPACTWRLHYCGGSPREKRTWNWKGLSAKQTSSATWCSNFFFWPDWKPGHVRLKRWPRYLHDLYAKALSKTQISKRRMPVAKSPGRVRI